MATTDTTTRAISVAADGVRLPGELALPTAALGVVAFAHGSGSSRHSPRNQAVAERLRAAGLGTVLIDLLSPEEERRDQVSAELRFDIAMLARRVAAVVDWLRAWPATRALPVGLFGASTGAAAALVAAAERAQAVAAVVSRGGRPDLAGPALGAVRAPVLLVVGGADPEVLRLNEAAAERLSAPHRLRVVPGAGHLFAEPGALAAVADAARDWFLAMGRADTP
ncbi:dienelactone hydrolase family protein [Streptomyces sp. NPDC057702]|uniref:dienelactone hydrolase family protein n=1 Tax=unclassified Streptomyces TaxID=2593676 RepID=UPI0036BA9DFB